MSCTHENKHTVVQVHRQQTWIFQWLSFTQINELCHVKQVSQTCGSVACNSLLHLIKSLLDCQCCNYSLQYVSEAFFFIFCCSVCDVAVKRICRVLTIKRVLLLCIEAFKTFGEDSWQVQPLMCESMSPRTPSVKHPNYHFCHFGVCVCVCELTHLFLWSWKVPQGTTQVERLVCDMP